MLKAAIIILADMETMEGLARVLNGLEAAKEFKDAGDDVKIIFDGAGVKCIPQLEKPDHMLHGLYQATRDRVAGACGFCANAFKVTEEVAACGIGLAKEYDDHPSIRQLAADSYQIMTY